MIISHKHKFIFIKTRKTSGTSMEISLSQFCGDDDIITPITYEDELVRQHIGDDIWNEYFKFTIERHPYDTVVSHIHFHARKKSHWNFETELKRTLKKGYFVSYPIYSDGEKPIVDFVVSYEQLGQDLETLSDNLGFDVAAHYPRTKHRHRADRRPARELLSDVTRQAIYGRCKVSFDAMGYER